MTMRRFGMRASSGALALLTAAITWPTLAGTADGTRVLAMSRTEGFRHPSIVDGHALLAELASAYAWSLEATEEASDFTSDNLAGFDVVVFLSTTGDILDPPEEQALRGFVESGGGWLGIHAAADTEHGWPWYGTLLGGDAWFLSHPAVQQATLEVDLAGAPSTACYPATFAMTDEWYNFAANPRDAQAAGPVEVLLTIDESSYDPGAGAMGDDHPIAWRHGVGLGRAWYTSLGHRPETWADPGFRQHLAGGLLWVAGADFADGFESADLCRWSTALGGRAHRSQRP